MHLRLRLQPSCNPPCSAVASTVLRPCSAASNGSAARGGAPHEAVRRIILLRHADSEASTKLPDYERPISIQGKREAMKVAAKLRSMGWLPDLILASNSKRTRQTLDQMADSFSELASVDAYFLGSLYTCAALDGQTRGHLQETILDMASDTGNQCVMCVGHNKGWEEAASSFSQRAVRLQTASAALLQAVGSSWSEVLTDDADWQLVGLITP